MKLQSPRRLFVLSPESQADASWAQGNSLLAKTRTAAAACLQVGARCPGKPVFAFTDGRRVCS